MDRAFKIVMKVFLLLVGGVMLLGGGVCAVTDVYLAIANGFRSDAAFMMLLTAVSSLIAWVGWVTIRVFGKFDSKSATDRGDVNN